MRFFLPEMNWNWIEEYFKISISFTTIEKFYFKTFNKNQYLDSNRSYPYSQCILELLVLYKKSVNLQTKIDKLQNRNL